MPKVLSTEDLIDFPVSWDVWRSYCYYFEGRDPGENQMPDMTQEERLQAITQELNIIEKRLPKNERQEIKQLKAQLVHIHNEVHELKAKPKRKRDVI